MPPKLKKVCSSEEVTVDISSQMPLLPMKSTVKQVKKPAKPKLAKVEADLLKMSTDEVDEIFQRVRNQRTLADAAMGMSSSAKKPSTTLLEELELNQLRYELGEVLQKQVELRLRERKLKQTIKRKQRNIILAHQIPSLPSESPIISTSHNICVTKATMDDLIILDEDDNEDTDKKVDCPLTVSSVQLSSAIDKLFPIPRNKPSKPCYSININNDSSSTLLWNLNRSIDVAATMSQRVDIARDCTLHFNDPLDKENSNDDDTSFSILRNYSSNREKNDAISTVKNSKYTNGSPLDASEQDAKEDGNARMVGDCMDDDNFAVSGQSDWTVDQWEKHIHSTFAAIIDQYCEYSEDINVLHEGETATHRNYDTILQLVQKEWSLWKNLQLLGRANELNTIQRMISFTLNHFLPQFIHNSLEHPTTVATARVLTIYSCLLEVMRQELLSLQASAGVNDNAQERTNCCKPTLGGISDVELEDKPVRVVQNTFKHAKETEEKEENIIVLDYSEDEENTITVNNNDKDCLVSIENETDRPAHVHNQMNPHNASRLSPKTTRECPVIHLLSPAVSHKEDTAVSSSLSSPPPRHRRHETHTALNDSPMLPLFERLRHIKHRFQPPTVDEKDQPLSIDNDSIQPLGLKRRRMSLDINANNSSHMHNSSLTIHSTTNDSYTTHMSSLNQSNHVDDSINSTSQDLVTDSLGIDVLPAFQQRPKLVRQYIDRLQQQLHSRRCDTADKDTTTTAATTTRDNNNPKDDKKRAFHSYAAEVIAAFVRHPTQRVLYNRLLCYDVVDVERDIVAPARHFYQQLQLQLQQQLPQEGDTPENDLLSSVSPENWRRVFTVDTVRHTLEAMHVFHKVTTQRTQPGTRRHKT